MTAPTEINSIKSSFAKCYDLDLPMIDRDVAALTRALQKSDSIELQRACSTSVVNKAYVPDLDTLAYATVMPDARLSDRHVEANLDEAMKLLQSCLLLRSQYGEQARHRNETRFKGEEFVRLDAVHMQEVDAGLYKLPWQEAATERKGLEDALAHAHKQRAIPQEMLQGTQGASRYSAVLSDAAVVDHVAKTAFITKNVANTHKDQVGQVATQTTQYRSAIELAAWHGTLANAEGTIAQLTAKLDIVRRKEAYLSQDEIFRLHRAQISRHLAWQQISEHCRPASELNYDERLKAVKASFDTNAKALAERIRLVDTGMRHLYGNDLPFGVPAQGRFLDEAAVWIARASDELAKWRRTQRLSLVSVSSRAVMASTATNGSFTTEFVVDEAAMPDRPALVRGANLEFVGGGSGPISVALTAPCPLTPTVGAQRALVFGRVCHVAPGLDLRPHHSDLLWNGDPCGIWKAVGSADPAIATPTGLVLYLWISSQ